MRWNLSRFLEADGFHQRGREEAGLGHVFARCADAEHFDCILWVPLRTSRQQKSRNPS